MQTVLLLCGGLFFVIGLVFLIVALSSGEMFFLAVALPLVLIGGILLFVAVRKVAAGKKLRETGMMVMATVTELTPNYSVTINGRHPYILHCVYNGIPYQADYNKTAVPDVIGRQIPVYLAQDGSGKYFVDVKALG